MLTDTEITLNRMRQQLLWLERELFALQKRITQSTPLPKTPRPFSALRGVWADVVVNEEDFEAARLKAPKDL
ncbi:MAG: hypothetical protein IT331_15075 [Anaerolineae bacterium]|nr:hypothetical protein [Anaerolineae bacterium]